MSVKRTVIWLFFVVITQFMCAEQRDGYRVESRLVPVSHNDSAWAYLLIPDHNQMPEHGFPAVVLFHDHGAYFELGREKMVFPTYDCQRDSLANAHIRQLASKWTNKYYEGIFLGDSLAKNGYVVLVIDALYWGSRSSDLDQITFYHQQLNTTGTPWYETILDDDKKSLGWLSGLPYVDSHRIAACGFSMGAYRAWQLASEDKRVACCVAANWMTTLEANGGGLKNQSAYSMYRPNLANVEYATIASKIAPRPFLLIYGANDKLFPSDAVHSAIDIIANEYSRLEESDQFVWKEVDAEHRFTHIHLRYVLDYLSHL